jgi:hypothetical protein
MDYQNYEYFVENLLRLRKDSEFIYNDIDFKNSAIRSDYHELVNDPELQEFFFKRKKKLFSSRLTKRYISNAIGSKIFYQNFLSYKYLKSILKISELPYFLYHFFFNLKFKFKDNSLHKQKKIFVYVNSLKHYYHQKFFLDSIKNEVIFITLSKRLINNLPEKEKIFFKPLNLVYPSLKFNTKSLSKEFYLYKVFENFISKNDINLVIGTEGDCPIFEILCKVSAKKNIKSVCIQWGAIPFTRPRLPFDNMSCNYFFTWGKFFENQLKKNNKNVKFISVGKKIILRKVDRKNLITFIMAPPVPDFPEEYNSDLLKIAKYISKKYKNWNFVIRNHPLYEINKNNSLNIKNLKIESFNNNPIDLCLKKSSIVVGICSSVLIEALYHHTIPVVYEANKKHKFYPRLDKNKIGFIRNDIKSTIKVIENLIIDKKKFTKTMNVIKNKKKVYFSNINKNLNKVIKKEIYKIYNNL